MLKVKSFKIYGDDEKINNLLTNYRLAKGGTLLVSEGCVLIPYDDGQPLSGETLKAHYLEQKNDEITKLIVVKTAQLGLNKLIEKTTKELADVEAQLATPKDSKTYESEKKFKERAKHLQSKIDQSLSVVAGNEHEIARLEANIEALDILIKSV